MPSTALNLHGVSTLIADSDAFMASLLARMIRGFGMGGPEIVDTMAKAREHLQRKVPDLVIVEATLSDGAGFELVSWTRHQAATPLRFVPVIMMSSSPRAKSVTAARDADRKSTRLNSSHMSISYAVFCLKKKINRCYD